MSSLAPIVLFTYNRLTETMQTVEALSRNHLAPVSDLYIFSDGPKNEADRKLVQAVREYLKTISGFSKIAITEAASNMGLANSIINGVSSILKNYDKVIVLEDDLVSAPNFLDFMNQALHFYKKQKKIISISGYSLNLPALKQEKKDYYVGQRASSWGWGIWVDRWDKIDWQVSDYDTFRTDFKLRKKFASIASDLPRMLKNQMQGKIDSWAIRLCYHQFRNEMIAIFPSSSKIISIGTNENATHTSGVTKFFTTLDSSGQRNFTFDEKPMNNEKINRQFKAVFSVVQRLKDKTIRIKNRLKRFTYVI